MKTISILIADNNTAHAEVLRTALAKNEGIGSVSIVSTRETAIKQVSNKPDVILLNPDILRQHSLSRFVRSVQTKSASSRILFNLKSNPTDAELISDIKTGIRGYVRMTDPPAIIARAMHAVAGGEIWAERRILTMAISKPMLLPETLHSHIPGLPPLTSREMEMLTLVLQGATNREIAETSSISERTVKTHLYRIYKKLKVKSRTKAIALLSQS